MSTTDDGLVILQLTAENIKRLRAVSITPESNIVVIAGRNGMGKSSVLDAISWTLGGKALMRDTARPIRDGEDSARVDLDLGEFTVSRTWHGERSTVTVTSKNGARYSSPQAFLDERLGALSFDPLAFSQKPDKEQVADLLALVDLPFDPEELANQRRAIFEERTDVNRELRRMEASVAGKSRPRVIPEEVNITDLLSQLQDAHQAWNQRQTALNELSDAATKVDELREQLIAAEIAFRQCEEAVAALPPPPDVDDIHRQVANAEAVNAEATRMRLLDQSYGVIERERAKADALTKRLVEIDRAKAEALETAEMPVPGLSFDDEGVTYQGIPFRQCSASERLRVSLGMAIAANPTIRVIRITDGSLLDSDNMAVIEQMAVESGSQVWIERVEGDSAVGFVIEDGEVRA